MSARSMARAHAREVERSERRGRRRVRQISVGAAAALGAGIAMAPSAQAATFTVNSNADGPASACDATCTLRDATDAANLDATADTITFAPSVTGEIELDSGEGYIPLYSAMTIQGPGAGTLSVDGDFNTQIFYAATDVVGTPNEPVAISGLTLKNADSGTDKGSAIYAYETQLSLDAMTLRGNVTDDNGAVYSDGGSLTVTNSTFTGNTAGVNGGAIYTDDDSPANSTTMNVVIRNSSFRGNAAGYSGGALYFDDETDSVLIANSAVANNSASSQGGGVRFYGPETATATIVDSTISGNTAGSRGGGVASYGTYDRPVEILNSTIAGNTAGEDAGGVYRYGYDSPSYAGTDMLTVSSSIVAGNDAPRGPDLAQRIEPTSPASGFIDVGFSLIGSTAGAPINQTPAGSNQLDVDSQLGPLASNGGPTQTILPATTSPAIDAGIANGLTTDQRGLPRTVKTTFTPAAGSDGTDIGAVELADAALDGATVKVKKKQAQKGKKVVVTVEVGATEDVQAAASGKVKAGKKNVKLKKVTKIVTGGQSAKLKLKPKNKKATKTILKVLDDGKKAKATLTVTLTDPAGNATTKKPKVTLKG